LLGVRSEGVREDAGLKLANFTIDESQKKTSIIGATKPEVKYEWRKTVVNG
jgi:hypothetical protein